MSLHDILFGSFYIEIGSSNDDLFSSRNISKMDISDYSMMLNWHLGMIFFSFTDSDDMVRKLNDITLTLFMYHSELDAN